MLTRKILLLLFVLATLSGVYGQDRQSLAEGSVTYISSQNVYVKFLSTEGISPGDTLYILKDKELKPALLVKNLSSISCVCAPLEGNSFNLKDAIYSTKIRQVAGTSYPAASKPETTPIKQQTDSVSNVESSKTRKQQINGRISVSSGTGFSSASGVNERMRYTLMLNAGNIKGSKISAETYISFSHRNHEWQSIKDNVFNGLKIYSLAAIYQPDQHSSLIVGRRINSKMSSVGALDGIQYEYRRNSFSAGVIAGSRPDVYNYGFNARLFQYGGYVSYESKSSGRGMQTTLAFLQQTNSGQTDRRFTYFQHSNNLLPRLNLFASAELDIYRKTDSTQDSKPRLTNLYLSLRYRISKQLSVSASYTNRQNIIYYETYKDIIERLLATESTQGYQAQVNYRPFNKLTLGMTAGYRFRTNDPHPSKNLYSFITYSSLPWLKVAATASFSMMESSYMKGNIYSAGFSRDLFKGKLYGTMNYRFVDYTYSSPEFRVHQHMGELSMTWRVIKKMTLSLNYEGTFEKSLNYSYLYIQLNKSF